MDTMSQFVQTFPNGIRGARFDIIQHERPDMGLDAFGDSNGQHDGTLSNAHGGTSLYEVTRASEKAHSNTQ